VVALSLILPLGGVGAQSRTPQSVLMSENERARAMQEQLGYADAVVTGDTIYLSGIVVGFAPGETSPVAAFERATGTSAASWNAQAPVLRISSTSPPTTPTSCRRWRR
jgi:hypothetical protein